VAQRQGQAGELTEAVIDRAMIKRAADALLRSGALAEPVFGLSVLAERILRESLLPHLYGGKGSKADRAPSRIASELDQYL